MSFEFFIEMAWKSLLISGLALIVVALLRSRSPADRAAVLRLGLLMLFLLPVVALGLPALEIEAASAPQIVQPLASAPATATPLPAATASISPGGLASEPNPMWDDPTPLIRIAYLAGLLMIGLKLLLGLLTLSRWTAGASEVRCPAWRGALERARSESGCSRTPRLLVSADCPAPLSWGWLRPVILIDPDTLRETGDADAILAHEMAHVARRDWPMLMLARLTVALFWFNPLVWLLERECIQQAEEAADSHALGRVEATHYAQTLLSCAQCAAVPVPANRVASNRGLGRRVRAILDGRLRATASGSLWTIAAMLGCVAIAAPVSALKLVQAAAPIAPLPPIAALAPAVPPPASAPDAAAPPAAPPQAGAVLPVAPPAPPAAPAAMDSPAPVAPVAPIHPPARIDEESIASEVEAAVEEAMATAGAHTEQAVRVALASVAHGAIGMEAGATGMEAGAAGMRAEAAKLRSRTYREQEIRRASARGQSVTHEALLDVAKGLEEGAEELRTGAREMREAAREMRSGDGRKRH